MAPFLLSYILLTNEFQFLNNWFQLKFEGFLEEDRQHFMGVLVLVGFLNYAFERALKYIKYGEVLDYI